MLEEILRTEQDERIQRSVVRALISSDNQRARSSMRALIDRKDAPVEPPCRSDQQLQQRSRDDRKTPRTCAVLYSRADNDRVKRAIINAVARIGGQENDQWLLDIAKNPNEPSQLRATAIARLDRSNISIADLSSSTTPPDSYDVRSRIVSFARKPQGARGGGQARRHHQEQHRSRTSARRR